MAYDLFEEFEDLIWQEEMKQSCEDFYGGLQECEIYFCPIIGLEKFKLPNILHSYENAGSITETIKTKNRRSFLKLDALIDFSELSASISASSSKTNLNIFLLGLTANSIGFSRKITRTPGVFIISDNNGRKWIIGHHISPATISINLSSGKLLEDNSGVTSSISCNSIFFEYKGGIPPYRKSDFTEEFMNEFF